MQQVSGVSGEAEVTAVGAREDNAMKTFEDKKMEKMYRKKGDYKEAEKYEHLLENMNKPRVGSKKDPKSDAVYKQIEKIYAMEGNGKEENVYKAKIGSSSTPKGAEKRMESAESQIEKIYAMEGDKKQKKIYHNILSTEKKEGFCTPGQFIGKKNSCEVCAPGKFSYGGKITWCEQCPAGRFGLGGSKTDTCSGDCPAGHDGQPGSHSITCGGACSAGRYAPKGSPCLDCPAGRFNFATRSRKCSFCMAGKYNEFPGSTECEHCKKGQYQPDHGMTSCESVPTKMIAVVLTLSGGALQATSFDSNKQRALTDAMSVCLVTPSFDVKISSMTGEESSGIELTIHVMVSDERKAETLALAMQSASFPERLKRELKSRTKYSHWAASEEFSLGKPTLLETNGTPDKAPSLNSDEDGMMLERAALLGIVFAVLVLAHYSYQQRVGDEEVVSATDYDQSQYSKPTYGTKRDQELNDVEDGSADQDVGRVRRRSGGPLSPGV
jgi:hypothetical protein